MLAAVIAELVIQRLRIAARKHGLTDDELVLTGFVTDAGILRPPFGAAIAAALVTGTAPAATAEGDVA